MNRQYPTGGYKVPKKNVLLISCIDLRLTDDLVRFMDHDNLTNRYDHFILAGASLGVTLAHKSEWQNHEQKPEEGLYDVSRFAIDAWWTALRNHIDIAVALHAIKDVYIVEHENCGAYTAFVRKEVLNELKECCCQQISSETLAKKIQTLPWDNDNKPDTGNAYKLHVHCFLIDLRGNVKLLHTSDPLPEPLKDDCHQPPVPSPA